MRRVVPRRGALLLAALLLGCAGAPASAPDADGAASAASAASAAPERSHARGVTLPADVRIRRVRAVPGGPVYAVGHHLGGGGLAYVYQGARWTRVPLPGDDSLPPLNAAWGSGADDVWLVGDRVVLRFDGASWVRVPVRPVLQDVWGSGPDDVWMVGLGGALLRFTPAGLDEVPSGTTADLYALAGCGPRAVWAVGAAGTVRRYDGRSWAAADPGALVLGARPAPGGWLRPALLSAACAPDRPGVWIGGEEGLLLQGDGERWTRVALPGQVGVVSDVACASDIRPKLMDGSRANVWLGTTHGPALVSDDGGRTWAEAEHDALSLTITGGGAVWGATPATAESGALVRLR